MSISSERLRELTETKIGEGQSRYVFGRHWKQLYKVLSEEEENLTEEMYLEGLGRCKFRDPEKDVYRFTIYIWYFILILTIISSLIDWKMDKQVPLMILCMVVTSWSFRGWSREWNIHELIYHTIKAEGKI